MPLLTIPTTFTAYTKIKSSEVNANFSAISTLLNTTKLDGTNIQNAGIDLTTKVTGVLPKANGGTGVDISTAALPLPEIATPSTPASGIISVYGKSDHKLYVKDSTGSEKAVATGSSSGINYINQYDAEGIITSWATYNDAAAATPVDGTGGSPAITWTTSSSSPIRGATPGAAGNSFLLTKTGTANRQGDGVSYDFTIDAADKAKVLTVSFEYTVSSGTFATADVAVYIYDITGTNLIQPSNYQLASVTTGNVNKYIATFQTSTNSSYRMILHVASTSTSDYVLKFDNFAVGPQTVQYGAPITDWVAYTPTLTSAGGGSITLNATGATNPNGYWRRIGDSMEVQISFRNGSGGAASGTAGSVVFGLPGSYTIDTSRQATAVGGNSNRVFGGAFTSFNTDQLSEVVGLNLGLAVIKATSGNIVAVADIAANSYITLTAHFPITGWGSTVVMSDSADTRVCAAAVKGSTTTLVNNTETLMIFPTVSNDTHGAYNASTGLFTCPVPGWYRVSAGFQNAASQTPASAAKRVSYATIRKNGTAIIYGPQTISLQNSAATTAEGSVTGSVYCSAGDTLGIGGFHNLGANGAADAASYFNVERLSGPSAIAASEKVYCQYTGNAGTVLTGSTTNMDFSTKVVDSHAAWNGTTFTAPTAGFYSVVGLWASTAGVTADTELYVGGVLKLRLFSDYASATRHAFSGAVYLNASDTMTIRSAAGCTLVNTATQHLISIYRQ